MIFSYTSCDGVAKAESQASKHSLHVFQFSPKMPKYQGKFYFFLHQKNYKTNKKREKRRYRVKMKRGKIV